jgi:hypothetical protein
VIANIRVCSFGRGVQVMYHKPWFDKRCSKIRRSKENDGEMGWGDMGCIDLA